jgi:hypothetical protein
MLRRIALIVVIAGSFSGAMYTTIGCGGSPTEPVTDFGTVSGTVTNAVTSAPIAAASVDFRQGNTGVGLFTDNSGRYDIIVPVGDSRVTVSKSGFQTFTTTITVRIGANPLDVHLQPGQ